MFYSRLLSAKRFFSAQTGLARQHIDKILIANRGEIACRVIKTARRLGVRTVAVYSDVDEKSLHVHEADEAFHIGAAPSSQSYLRSANIINVAKRSNCQAIHPGYGFLSESVEFSDLCQREGIIFIGPPASAIREMGIKSKSKTIMAAAGVPIINGYHGDDQSDERLQSEAQIIGFPLMIKAVRGGGGKGMRIANSKNEFMDALQSARTESEKAFGDGSVLLERYVRSPRHVEVQVFADMHGNAVYLYERDCSVQRRHQKIIEEAPAPGLSEELRTELGLAAVRAAKAVGYVGAGTVEFILDKEDLSFHFMEMNTRLQVEHPITEMITNTDLVEWQIRIASGEPLPVTQSDIKKTGHAFEARIYAESPRNGFLPGAGPLKHLSTPLANNFVRIETGVRQNDEVSVHYDPMIAKLVVWGETRAQALNSLTARLREYHISGLDTNVNFLLDLAAHPSFQSADVHTGFIDQHFNSLFPSIEITNQTITQAIVAQLTNERIAENYNSRNQSPGPFSAGDSFRVNFNAVRTIKLLANEKKYKVQVKYVGNDYEIKVDDSDWVPCSVQTFVDSNPNRFTLKLNLNGVQSTYSAFIDSDSIDIFNENGKTEFNLVQPKFMSQQSTETKSSGLIVISPMPGICDKILVKAGDQVESGQPVAVIIAMKMEYVIKAPRDAVVKSVSGQLGKNVAKGEIIVSFVEEESDEMPKK